MNYTFIPVIAVICYLFLFITFAAAKKNRLITEFMLVLLAMIAWAGGSVLMRSRTFPSTDFWFYVSLLGILLFFPALYQAVEVYLNKKRSKLVTAAAAVLVAVWAFNCMHPVFVKAPEVVPSRLQGRSVFIYEFPWPVVFVFLLEILMLLLFLRMIWQAAGKGKKQCFLQLRPILMGVLVMAAGHICLLLPCFKGIPIDVVSGIPMAFCIFYTLYKKDMFQMNLLASRASCYFVSFVIVCVIFYEIIPWIIYLFQTVLGMGENRMVLFISLCVMLATLFLYMAVRMMLDGIFGNEDAIGRKTIKGFTEQMSRLLSVDEIAERMKEAIVQAVGVQQVFIFVRNEAGDFEEKNGRPGYQKLVIAKEDPLLQLIKSHDHCLRIQEYKSSGAYEVLTTEQKRQIADKHIVCIAAIQNEQKYEGLIVLSGKSSGYRYRKRDWEFLRSLNAVASIAVNNSMLYSKALEDSRRDYLTGAVNRRYFLEMLAQCKVRKRFAFGSLIMVSVDDFKLYNQLYGEEEGDRALCRIVRILEETIGDTGVVARYSGKVFAVMLPEHEEKEAQQTAELFSGKIAASNGMETGMLQKSITVSCGIAKGVCATDDFNMVIKKADQALYYAKQQGKNRIVIYTEGTVDEKHSLAYKRGVYSEYASTVYALTAAIDAKDHYTFSHSENVAYYARQLAIAYGMNEEGVQIAYEAGLLHDIGKIGIDEHILNKPGKLTQEEYEIMKRHVEFSIGIIRHLPSLDYVIPAVIGHHERYDGKGYPRGIKGENIPLLARILCIADAFDAMLSRRSYKECIPLEQALSNIRKEQGKQFDPVLAPLFIQIVEEKKVELKL